jgi:hypothetical protein
MLSTKHKSSDTRGHEQIAPAEARPNPLDALRGKLHAVDQPGGRRVDQHGFPTPPL